MCYGSWSGGIFTLEVDPKTGYLIHPKSGTTSDGRMVDSYFGTKISGGYGKSGEGPFIEYNADTGYYYLWVTYGGLFSDGGYNMRVFRSTSPLGPFKDPAGNNAVLPTNPNLDATGLKVMGNYKFSSLNKAYMACGHNSVLRDDDGKWYLFYHARFDDGSEYHEVRVHSMYFNDAGWPVVAPFEYSGDEISSTGYNTDDIVGTYEFIDNGTSTDGKIISSQNIKLNADGTISGAVSGTWQQDAANSAADLTIGGAVYKGHFLAAKDESGKKVMSFTAVGTNNHTVWGAKTSGYTGTDRTGIADYTDRNAKMVIAEDTLGEPGASSRLSGTSLISGIPYYITNVNSGLAIDLPNGKLNEGTNIQQWDFNKLWAQQWRITAVDKEWCKIVSLGDEQKCIAVASDTAADGTNVELQTYTGTDNQLFKIVKSGSSYGIVSKCSGGNGALDVFEWSKENGGNVNQYAYHEYACQLWDITPVRPEITAGNSYVIRDVINDKYVSLGEKDQLVTSDKPTKWEVYSTGDNDGSYCLGLPMPRNIMPIVPVLVAPDGNNPSEEGALIVYRSVSNDNDARLKIIANKNGTYSLLTGATNYKQSVSYMTNMSSTPSTGWLEQLPLNKGKGWEFVLEPVKPDPDSIAGDVNADGEFGVADLVMLERYLLGASSNLNDWQAGDLDSDGAITAYDMVLMRKLVTD